MACKLGAGVLTKALWLAVLMSSGVIALNAELNDGMSGEC